MKEQYELSDSVAEDKQVLDILAGFTRLRQLEARRQFASIARKGADRVFLNTGGMGGHLNSQVQADSFHYWGQRLGYQCWDDPQFVKEYLRDNEYARVKSKPRNPTVSMATTRPATKSNKRFNFSSANFGGLKLAA